MSTALIVFAKAPRAGLAKTRLIPSLGAAGAAALAERLLVHAVQQAADAAVALGGHLQLCVTPDTEHPAFAALARQHGLALTLQAEGDLGQRMHQAFTQALQHADQALIIGTDAPALDTPMLCAAASALRRHDAVFVPAHDGGYALVGLSQPAPALFEDIAWSTSTVMQHTRDRAAGLGLLLAELPAVADIDEPADLRHLPAHWHEGLPSPVLPTGDAE
jgi:uncharacterized protein